jgi:hypothetical protein
LLAKAKPVSTFPDHALSPDIVHRAAIRSVYA